MILALRTADGGQTWEQEELPLKIGALHLSSDGTTLAVVGSSGKIAVLHYQGS